MGRRKGKGKPKKRAHPIELHASRVHTLARGAPLPKPYINKVRVRVCVYVCTCADIHVYIGGRVHVPVSARVDANDAEGNRGRERLF